MKNQITLIVMVATMLFAACKPKATTQQTKEVKLTQYVDPFIGTDFHGHTFPGATTPFGMVQLSPDNPTSGWDWSSGYHYSSDTIAGFSHTHLSGTGVGDLLDVSVMPIAKFDDQESFNPADYYSRFSHDNEDAEPGYYTVLLDNNVSAELTATKRCGVHKYYYPVTSEAHLMFDLGFWQNTDKPYETSISKISENSIEGYRFSSGWAKDQKLYFYAEFSSPIKEQYLFNAENKKQEAVKVKSENAVRKGVKAVLNFGALKEPLVVKVGISSSGIAGAKNNLMQEVGSRSFDEIRTAASNQWEQTLAKIEVECQDESKLRTFYTAMYNSHIAPNTYSDVDGSYTGIDGKVHQNTDATNYYTFSLWDTYRASHPLFTLIQPERVNDFMEAFLMQYNESGLLPVWSLWGNETNCMIGYHAIPVIVDAYFKGLIKGDMVEPLYLAMQESANQKIRGTFNYKTFGYIPCDLKRNSVSTTLEYAYDDWCIAQMAKALGKDEDFQIFSKRALSYRSLFNKESKLMQPKLKSGEWKEFDPFNTGYKNDYTEANAFQYTWYVPQNVPDLIALMGGANEFETMLDSIFNMEPEVGEHAAKDVSGFIGQYIHGNEPSHHIAYLFNYVGAPYKTQEKIDQIMREMYTDKPDGLCGNEDCGQMSSWYIFSAMGMYPVNPANGKYDVGKPAFPKMTVNLGNSTFEIVAHDISDENIYVQKMLLNGQEYKKGYFNHADVVAGGKLEFFMGERPNKGLILEY